MEDQAGPVTASSEAIVPHSSSDDPPSPVVFALGRLPPELRDKVIIAIVDGGRNLEAVCRLSSVHPEFNQLLARFRWESIQLSVKRPDATSRDTLGRMTSFAESMSPVYGTLVQEVYLCKDRPTEGSQLEEERARPLAQILIDLPNVQKLRIRGSQHLDTISMSPHLSSLTDLHIGFGVVSTALVALISHSHNLDDVRLSFLTSHPDERPPLITALASRRLLRDLTLHRCDFVDKSFLTADWQCPLVSLTIERVDLEFPLPVFRTFLSHFSRTLNSLGLEVPSDHWFRQRADLTPFPLPRLGVFTLFDCIPKRTVPFLQLFASSPLYDIYLDALIPDETSLEALRRFIRSHEELHGTIETIQVNTVVHYDVDALRRVRALIGVVEDFGIEIDFPSLDWTPLDDASDDEDEGGESEEGEGD